MKKVELNLIRKLAWSFHYTTGVEYEELFSEASLAYCEALAKFDEQRGVKFLTYAYTCMRNALSVFCHKQKQVPQLMEQLPDTPHYRMPLFELLDEFTAETREVVERVLEYPHDYLEVPPKMTRGQLVQELVQEGKTFAKAWGIVREIKTVVS